MGNSPGIKLTSFLNKADELYIEAFTTQKFKVLSQDFSRDIQLAIIDYTTYYRLERDFAIRRLRKNTWEIIDENDEEITLIKIQRFEKIRISLFKSMAAAQDYQETWKVSKQNRKYIVTYIGNYRLI